MENGIKLLTKVAEKVIEHENRVRENEEELKRVKEFLPKINHILNRFEGLDEWRISSHTWTLKGYDENGLVFGRIINGVQEEVKMDEDTFRNIREENFDDFNIKVRENKVREYIYSDRQNGLEIPESLVRYIKQFTFPKGFGFDSVFKKKSSSVDKERVLELIRSGEKTKTIAKQMGCSESYISQLKKKFSSKDLKLKT